MIRTVPVFFPTMKPTARTKAKMPKLQQILELHSYFKLHLYIKLTSNDAKKQTE